MRFASVDHTDEEPHRRLNCVQQSAAPFFTAPVRTGKVGFVEPVDVLWN
jgi:hypothetical protein